MDINKMVCEERTKEAEADVKYETECKVLEEKFAKIAYLCEREQIPKPAGSLWWKRCPQCGGKLKIVGAGIGGHYYLGEISGDKMWIEHGYYKGHKCTNNNCDYIYARRYCYQTTL